MDVRVRTMVPTVRKIVPALIRRRFSGSSVSGSLIPIHSRISVARIASAQNIHRQGAIHRIAWPKVGAMTGISMNTRSEEHTSELQSLMRISYAVFCLKKKTIKKNHTKNYNRQSKATE